MRNRLLAVVVTGLAVLAAAPAAAAPTQHTEQLKLSGDPHVTGSHSVTVKAKKIPLGTLTLACWNFSFTGDLVDPGEGLTITPSDLDPGGGPGFENIFDGPIETRTLCVDDPGFLAEIADGNGTENFVVEAYPSSSSTSFTLSSVTLELTYA